MKISIGLKLAFLFSIVILMLLLPITFIINYSSQQSIEKIIKEEFMQSRAMAQNHFDLLTQTTNLLAKNVAEDHNLLRLFFSSELETLHSYLNDKQEDLNCDQIVILDEDGNLVTQAGQLPFEAANLRRYELVEETYTQRDFHTAIIRQGDVFVFYTTEPIVIGEKLEGVVLAGLTINNKLMENIKKHTRMDFSIVGDRSMAATSFKKENITIGTLPVPYTEYLWLLKNPSSFLEATINDIPYYISAEELHNTDPGTNASIMLAYESDEIEEIQHQLHQTTIITIVSVIAMIILLSFLFGRGLHKRIQQLIEMTKKIKTGHYDARLPVTTSDELGQLSTNLNSMGEAILEKDNRLKEYTNSLEIKVNERTEAINIQKQYLSAILDMQSDLIIMIENQRAVFANQPFLQFFELKSIDTFNTPEKLCTIFGLTDILKMRPGETEKCLSVETLQAAAPSDVKLHTAKGEEKIYHLEFIPSHLHDDAFLVVFSDITTYKQQEEHLYRAATTDALTALPNRMYFNERVDKAIKHFERYQGDTFLLLFDIDDFKKINDRHGHDAGDEALQSIGILIKMYLRKSDAVARWGGEEFAAILYNINEEQALATVEKLREKIAEEFFSSFGHMTCSFGLTKIIKDDIPKTLFKRVDDALYQAKEEGKNRVITSF